MWRHRGRKNIKKYFLKSFFHSRNLKKNFMTIGLLEKKLQGGGQNHTPPALLFYRKQPARRRVNSFFWDISPVPVYMSGEHEIIIWFLGGFCFYGPYRWTFTQSSSWNPGNLLVAGRQRWGLPQILDGQPSSQPMGQNMGLSHIIGCRMMRGVWKIICRHLPYIKISYKSR